jgi:histone acetyltransferase 1
MEMFLLGQIPIKHRSGGGANITRLLVKKHNAEDENDRRYYWWRMLVKQRLYKRSRDVLIQLDPSDRIQKLEETVTNVEEGYDSLLKAFNAREESLQTRKEEAEELLEAKAAASEETNGSSSRTKRKYTIIEDEEDI